MAESKIKIYKDNPTAGGTDGTLVSSGTGLDPIESGAIKVPKSGYAEGNWIKLAVRCDPGYETVEDSSRHARISIEDRMANSVRVCVEHQFLSYVLNVIILTTDS